MASSSRKKTKSENKYKNTNDRYEIRYPRLLIFIVILLPTIYFVICAYYTVFILIHVRGEAALPLGITMLLFAAVSGAALVYVIRTIRATTTALVVDSEGMQANGHFVPWEDIHDVNQKKLYGVFGPMVFGIKIKAGRLPAHKKLLGSSWLNNSTYVLKQNRKEPVSVAVSMHFTRAEIDALNRIIEICRP